MYDLIIIGMGPSGMSAGVYAKRRNLNVLILENNTPGGAVLKAETIDNYLGFSKIKGSDLALSMFNHINDLGVSYKIENVLKIEDHKDIKTITTNKGTYNTKTILIANGKGLNKLIINNKPIIAKNISYCTLCDGALYKNKDVVLISEDEKEKVFLENIVNKLYVINKDEIKDIVIENDLIKELILSDKKINVDGIFLGEGNSIKVEFDKDLNIRNNGKITVNEKYETKANGIYASGDVINKDLYQVCNAVSEGAEAVVNIIKYLGEE